MKNKFILIITLPLVFLIEVLAFSFITALARKPSDVSVIMAFVLLCLLFLVNYFIVKFIVLKFQSKPDEESN